MFRSLLAQIRYGLSTSKGFHTILGGYLAIVFLIRAGLFPGVTNDDAEQLLLSQAMAWGYGTRNPPLFTWLVIAMQQIVGVSVFATEAVKFALLFLTYALIYRTARLIFRDSLLAALAALSLLAVYQFLWDAVINYSHTVLLAAASAAFLYAILRLGERKDMTSYLLIGLVLGIGILGKYNFIAFAVTLIVVAMTDKQMRRCLISAKALLSLALALLVVMPHLLWVLENPAAFGFVPRFTSADFLSLFDGGVGNDQPSAMAGRQWAVKSLGSFVQHYVLFFGPLGLLLFLNFRKAFAPFRLDAAPIGHRRLLGIAFAILTIGVAIYVVAFNAPEFRPRYMVIFAVFPMFLFACFDPVKMGERQINRYVLSLALLALLVPVVLLAAYLGDPRYRCKRCYLHVNYPAIAETLSQAGFETGTILSLDRKYPLSGGLRPYFPGARIFSWKFPTHVPPPSRTAGQCLLIWSVTGDVRQDRRNEAFVRRDAKRWLHVNAAALGPSQRFRHKLLMSDDRAVEFGYILVPEGTGDCR